ncbi:hypothetical protein NLJ89_g5709 [Agrocybe chaxingu]|uniref:Uncharacterized protein n=1 Tax=Agrocybe chaxingu TaxID=84603 RepID=A0A9W8K1Y5_9AGAR|nr:hypothetical protein NLJ89_g5709 [Agrocybe chaxingu]
MPFVKISPPTGPLNVSYSISTPESHKAKSIICGLPTVLFLHPVYIPQQVFEAQFSDFGLRQFNLIAFDMRSHGETEGVIGDAPYNAVEDVYDFIHTLARGEKSVAYDKQLLDEAVLGMKQLAFNNSMNPLTSAIVNSAISQSLHHWAGTGERTREGFHAAVMWPLERKIPSKEDFQKILCPIQIIYCLEDVAYTLENAQHLQEQFGDAGLKVQLHQVHGPHYGCIGGAKEINPIVRQFVLSLYDNQPEVMNVSITAEFDGVRMKTPFDDLLERFDYHPSDHSENELGL